MAKKVHIIISPVYVSNVFDENWLPERLVITIVALVIMLYGLYNIAAYTIM